MRRTPEEAGRWIADSEEEAVPISRDAIRISSEAVLPAGIAEGRQ